MSVCDLQRQSMVSNRLSPSSLLGRDRNRFIKNLNRSCPIVFPSWVRMSWWNMRLRMHYVNQLLSKIIDVLSKTDFNQCVVSYDCDF